MRIKRSLSAGIVSLIVGIFCWLSPLPGHASSLILAPSETTISVVEGVLRNRTLYEALIAYQIPPAEILSLSKSFKPVFDFRSARPKDYYRISVDDQNLIRKFVYKTSPMDEYEAVKDKDGGYSVHKRDIVLDRRQVAKVFTIDTSLYEAVADAGETQQIAGMIADIFAWDIDFYLYPRKGDRIAVVYERCYKDGDFVKYGDILAARYVGKHKTFSAFLFDDGRFNGYYDETGQPLKKMFLRTPLKFGKMTSRYSIRRFHPVLKRYRAHTGIDYGARTGTPILATANGRVKFAGWKGGYGKLIILKHANGYQTYYGHCSRLLRKRGQLVEQGQVIARVGSTGLSTGPHVHYEVRVNGKPINPIKVKKSRGKPLKPELLVAFKKTVDERLVLVENLLVEQTSLVMLTRDD
ncbi:MAG: peptidoglycan DD-metalloendopeptidase family protein [Desulfosarcina sp.]|jgi:murein DD-endopeptidase MepM/ murein hydrolase activator NlpD